MNRTVILAAGDFPRRGGEPWRLLASAARVVACDSAALDYFKTFGRWPAAVVGDLDSLTVSPACPVVRRRDPDSNDLSKAIAWCRARGWTDLVAVGATGRREDHAIGNVFRALAEGVRIESDHGSFLPVAGSLTFRTTKGTGVSVFASDPSTRMTSRGLRWKLAGVVFSNPYCATLNRASAERVTVVSDRPALAYVARDPAARRAVVSLGSNLGDRARYLRRALAALSRLPRTHLLDASRILETEPVGVPSAYVGLKFLNQAAAFETTLAPEDFARRMHAIEDLLGRIRTVRNGPRTIDLDLISYQGVTLRTRELILPHPRARKRGFVLTALAELGVLSDLEG